MAVISILNPKGGCGKTTIATNLARAFHERNCKVLLVDSDPQGSARDWHAVREDNPLSLIALDRTSTIRTLRSLTVLHDLTIIDGAAKLEDMIAATVKASDFVFIPVQPSPYDLWATADLAGFIQTRQELADGKPRAAFLINRTISGTVLSREVHDALTEQPFAVLASQIAQRQVYPRTAAEGHTVFDAGNLDAKAEFESLADEVQIFSEKGSRP